MKIKELVNVLDSVVIPKNNQESYDNCGLIVGSGEEKIFGILTTLDITPEVVEEAERLGCNLIIAHHPIIFFGIKNIIDNNRNNKSIMMAIRKNISIYAAHTSLDNRFSESINEHLAKKIGLSNVLPLNLKSNEMYSSHSTHFGSGAIGTLENPEFVVDYLHNLTKKLNINGGIRFSSFTKNVKITRVAICSGAGLFMAKEAKAKGAELFITSDINYHGFFDENDIVLADIGHYHSEKFAGEIIANLLKKYCLNYDLTENMIFVSKIDTNPITHAI